MPAKTEKQRRFMGAELARKRAGKKTKTGMSESKLSEFASKSIDTINAYLDKANIPSGIDKAIVSPIRQPGERSDDFRARGAQVDKIFAKSMNLIDVYLFKHAQILPCGHPAEEGSEIDKACSVSGCDVTVSPSTGSSYNLTKPSRSVSPAAAALSSTPITDSTTGKATTIGALPGGTTFGGRTTFRHTATGAPGDVDDFI